MPRGVRQESPQELRERHRHCGRRQVVLKGHAQLRIKKAELGAEKDIYFTEELFGAGFAQRKIVVSQRFYRCIQDNALGRNLVFEPVILSDGEEK